MGLLNHLLEKGVNPCTSNSVNCHILKKKFRGSVFMGTEGNVVETW
jgi:hypothetical protein